MSLKLNKEKKTKKKQINSHTKNKQNTIPNNCLTLRACKLVTERANEYEWCRKRRAAQKEEGQAQM